MTIAQQIIKYLLEDEDSDWKDVTALPLEDRLTALRFRRETEAIWMLNSLPGISSLVVWHRYDDTWDILGWSSKRHGQTISEIGLKTDDVIPRLKEIYAKNNIRWVEEAEERITLGDLFIDHRPEQWVWDMFSHAELDVPLPIKEVDPNKLLAHGNPLEELVHVAEMPVHMSLIKAYRKNPEGPILIDGPNILDGHHRAMAAFLEKRKVRAVDIRDWPISESFDDDDDSWKSVTPDLQGLLTTAGFTQRGGHVWIYPINKWMRYIVTHEGENLWSVKVYFDEMVLDEFTGTEIEMARFLEAKENWPKHHFSTWNRFVAVARGKGIRDHVVDESEEDFDLKDLESSPQQERGLKQLKDWWPYIHTPNDCYYASVIIPVYTQTGMLSKQNSWTGRIRMKDFSVENPPTWEQEKERVLSFAPNNIPGFYPSKLTRRGYVIGKPYSPMQHRFYEAMEDESNWKDVTVPPERTPFLNAYIEAAFFTDEEQLKEELEKLHEEGRALDVEEPELSEDTLLEMEEDCRNFESQNAEDLSVRDTASGAHDFWFTRNGHGAGFWDGDWPKPEADRLTKASKAFGAVSLYLGDDGKVYQM